MAERKIVPPIVELPPFTPEQIQWLQDYLKSLEDAARSGAAAGALALTYHRAEWVQAQHDYWRNVASGLKWARGRIRLAVRRNERRAASESDQSA